MSGDQQDKGRNRTAVGCAGDLDVCLQIPCLRNDRGVGVHSFDAQP